MSATSHFYPIVSRVAAVVLLIAGGMKTQELLSVPASTSWAVFGSTAFELLFGLWLLIGLYPRWTRIIALACFAVFLNVALLGALQGRTSCGCFGKASVKPWSAVALDALMIGGLLLSPAARPNTAARSRWFTFTISALGVLLLLGWPLAEKLDLGAKHVPTQAGADMPAGADETVLDRVIQSVEQNHAALPMLIYTTEKVIIQHPVEWPKSWQRPVWNGKEVVTGSEAAALIATLPKPESVEKHSRHRYKTWTRGSEVRKDGERGDILLSSKGKRIQYAPEIQQAWISTSPFADAGFGAPIDLRCAGFQPPLKSIADWLKRCEVLNAGLIVDRAGRDVVRVRAHVKSHSKAGDEVTADFLPATNYMPSRVVYSFLPDGGVFTVTDIEYQQIGPKGAWFPREITQRCFLRNTTADPDASSGQNISDRLTVKVLAVGEGVHDEDFDPILPAETRLVGDLAAQPWTGDAPIRASKVTRKTPKPIKNIKGAIKENISRTSPWPFAAGMDVLLFGICLVFRKQLVF